MAALLYVRTILSPSFNVTIAFFQSGRKPREFLGDKFRGNLARTLRVASIHFIFIWLQPQWRNGLTSYGYNNADQVTTVTTPPPRHGPGAPNHDHLLQQPTRLVADGYSLAPCLRRSSMKVSG